MIKSTEFGKNILFTGMEGTKSTEFGKNVVFTIMRRNLTLEALGRQNDVRSCFQIIAAVKKIVLCGWYIMTFIILFRTIAV